MALGIASAEIKSKLENLLTLLQQDIAQQVDDSDPAKIIFKALRQIPTDAEEILFQVAHLESRQLQYQRATQRLADTTTYAQLKEEMLQVKHATDEKHKSINTLQSSAVELKQKIFRPIGKERGLARRT